MLLHNISSLVLQSEYILSFNQVFEPAKLVLEFGTIIKFCPVNILFLDVQYLKQRIQCFVATWGLNLKVELTGC